MSRVKVARDFNTLKECVSVWGLRENRRESPRYRVDIEGNYRVEQKGLPVISGTCRLVDVNKEGFAVMILNVQFHEGTTLHFQFFPGLKRVDVAGKAVYIDWEDDGCRVGIESITKKIDIAKQLLE
jgi:hypothetical protein